VHPSPPAPTANSLSVNVNTAMIEEAQSILRHLFSQTITAPEIVWANCELGYLTGGCYCSSPSTIILINSAFKDNERYLFYQRSEVIAHELVHHQRARLQSVKYEEIIAYQTSPNRFRRYWGGVFRTRSEPIIITLFSLSFFVSSLVTQLNSAGWLIRSMTLITFTAYLSFLLIRHYLAMRSFKSAARSFALTETNPLKILLHCNDQRIDAEAQKYSVARAHG
jgi:hypothetical protein